MYLTLSPDGRSHEPPEDIGLAIWGHGVTVCLNTDGTYLSLESPAAGALYRLRRRGSTLAREAAPPPEVIYRRRAPGVIEALWWPEIALVGDLYQALITDAIGRATITYVALDRGRIFAVTDEAAQVIEWLFLDAEGNDYPDAAGLAALAAALPTTILPADAARFAALTAAWSDPEA